MKDTQRKDEKGTFWINFLGGARKYTVTFVSHPVSHWFLQQYISSKRLFSLYNFFFNFCVFLMRTVLLAQFAEYEKQKEH